MALMALGWRHPSAPSSNRGIGHTEGRTAAAPRGSQTGEAMDPGHMFPYFSPQNLIQMGSENGIYRYTSKWPLKIGKMMNKAIGFGGTQFLDNPNDPKKLEVSDIVNTWNQ